MKIRSIIVVTCAVSLSLMSGACGSAPPGTPSAKPVEQASADSGSLSDSLALATLRDLRIPGLASHGQDFVKPLGFASADEMRRATLVAPVALYRVPIASVGEYDETTEPDATLVDAQIRIYPVVSGGVVVSAVTISTAEAAPRVVSLGRGAVARSLNDARDLASGATNDGEAPFAVELAGLGVWYVGHHDGQGALWLTPLRADARVPGSSALESVPARRVFASLKPYALAAQDVRVGHRSLRGSAGSPPL